MAGGLRYVGTDSQDPQGKLKKFDVAVGHATILAKGDVFRITGTATAATGVPQGDAAAAAQSITGVIAGIVPDYSTEALSDTGLPASTLGSVLVNTDPRALYEADVTNGPLLVADVGLNVDIVATAATKSGGMTTSNMTINATGKNTTSTLQFRVIKLLVGSDGVLGSRVLVRMNETTNIAGATGV